MQNKQAKCKNLLKNSMQYSWIYTSQIFMELADSVFNIVINLGLLERANTLP